MYYLYKNGLTPTVTHAAMIKKMVSQTKLDHHDYHPHYEIYYCRDRIAQDIIINGSHLVLDGPAIIFSAPFSIHGMERHEATDTVFERYIIYFDDAFLRGFADGALPDSFFNKYPNCIYPLDERTNERMSHLFDGIVEAGDNTAEFSAYFAAIVNTVTRVVPPDMRITKGAGNHYIVDVLKHIYNNKTTSLDADEIAKKFHVSRAKLDRDFRRFVGQSIHKTVMDCRLGYATEMLIGTDMQIRDVALHCGFESEYYFYAFFKREAGMTPSEARKGKRATASE